MCVIIMYVVLRYLMYLLFYYFTLNFHFIVIIVMMTMITYNICTFYYLFSMKYSIRFG